MKQRPPIPRTRKLTVIAQDPGLKTAAGILRSQVEVPAEELRPGPWGYRVQVVDYDVSTDTYYRPQPIPADEDPYAAKSDEELLGDPNFHCQNVYALVMRALARFEFALGRRVSWGFQSHQLNIVPHAFADANAFYSRDDNALLFGYFPGHAGMVFTCLSHDVVVHEATHALLDGLRERYNDPSSPDQSAFHEGFADIVALLSVFSLPGVASFVIDRSPAAGKQDRINPKAVTAEKLRRSILFGLAEEMGRELGLVRGDALRRSVELTPSPDYYASAGRFEEFIEPHRRGEILVAAVMNGFLEIWAGRIKRLGEQRGGGVDRGLVIEQGADIAGTLLTSSIRALDYAPAVDVQFGDYLSALLTADTEVRPDDSRFELRKTLLASFRAYGIEPASDAGGQGVWEPPAGPMRYDRTHFEAMRRDEDEVFRFIWENRKTLKLCDEAYTRVLSLRPCLRIGPDGFALHETVAEFYQVLEVRARELADYGIAKPEDMPDALEVKMYGGGALVFDEYGQLKFYVHNNVLNGKRQSERLDYLWRSGSFKRGASAFRRLSALHRERATGFAVRHREEW